MKSRIITATELATYLGLSPRQGRELCGKWIEEGFLVIENAAKKGRRGAGRKADPRVYLSLLSPTLYGEENEVELGFLISISGALLKPSSQWPRLMMGCSHIMRGPA